MSTSNETADNSRVLHRCSDAGARVLLVWSAGTLAYRAIQLDGGAIPTSIGSCVTAIFRCPTTRRAVGAWRVRDLLLSALLVAGVVWLFMPTKPADSSKPRTARARVIW